MALEILAGLLGAGIGILFLTGLILGFLEFFGRIYGTFRCLIREDLSTEQRLIYLLLIWFIPLGWLIYFLLGTERSRELFSDVEFI